jgi:oligoendopeptidase F
MRPFALLLAVFLVTAPFESRGAATWDLTELYPSADAWSTEQTKVAQQIATLPQFKGTLARSPQQLLAALQAESVSNKEANRLAAYAALRRDEDVRVSDSQERAQTAIALLSSIGEATSWMNPEILAIGADKVHAFEQQSPELEKLYGHFLDGVLRGAPHTLSAEAEGVVAAAANMAQQPNSIFSQLANGDLPFPTITLSDGTQARLDTPAYEKYRQSPNRADRKLVFDSFWNTWSRYQGTFGQILATQVMTEEFDASVHHYPSALADALFADNMPAAVYEQLVAQANAGLPQMYRYLRLRKQRLGVQGDLAYYDVYPSLFEAPKSLSFSVEDAKKLAFEATVPFGPEYRKKLQHGFDGRWIDIAPHPGKAPGGYMNPGAYDVHPYLLLNYNDDYQSLSTYVHEWGHAVHTLLANEVQPYPTANYSAFTAETASISNEMLLNDKLVAHARTNSEKLYYLGQGLELIRGSFFRQVMFAEFQLSIHQELEQGRALSGQRLTDLYCGVLKKYYGDAQGAMKIDPAYCIEWAFVPHFYYGFYVWQYATSIAGASQLTDAIERGDKDARTRFINMLKAGGSDYPYNLYRKAGLDMATPAPYQALVARMSRIMDQIEALSATKKEAGTKSGESHRP